MNDDFLWEQGRKLGNHDRFVEQGDEPMESIEHRSVEPLYPDRLKGLALPRPLRLDFGRDLRNEISVELEHDAQIGFRRSGSRDVVRNRQIDGRQKRLPWPIRE